MNFWLVLSVVSSEIILGPKFPETATNAAQIKYFKALQQIEEDGDCPVTPSKIKGIGKRRNFSSNRHLIGLKMAI